MFNPFNINWFAFIALLVIVLSLFYRYLTRNFNYWELRGIRGPKPVILFGSMYDIFRKPFNQIMAEEYKKYGRFYGIFFGHKPAITICEPQLLKDILIKDFNKFVNHNDVVTGDPMNDRSLFNAFDDEWKQLRSVISPTFSSGKMRRMHPLIENCVKSVESILKQSAIDKKEIEIKKLMGNFTMDVISTCAFATKIDTHNDVNNPFVKNAQLIFSGSWRVWFAFILAFTLPKSIVKRLQLQFFDSHAVNFFKQAVTAIIEKRKVDNRKHIDFLQLMLNAQKKEVSEEVDDKNLESTSIYDNSDNIQIDKPMSKFELSELDILATAFLFFVAGYETTAALISFLFYSLAVNEECQQKLYEELKSVDKLDYDTISRLTYLDACVAETQRLYTASGGTTRIAAEDYKLGDTGYTIPKGMLVQFNFEGIHHDPEYYPNPEQFDPERFMPENRHKLIPYTFLPFGIGPRNCVGMRFALMEAKTAIAHIIAKFKFVRTANTEVPLEFKDMAITLIPKRGIKVGVEIRNV